MKREAPAKSAAEPSKRESEATHPPRSLFSIDPLTDPTAAKELGPII